MDIRLLVLRTTDLKRIADFYNLLGFTFEYHSHGNSPFHYSAAIGPTTLEIYPLAKGQTEVDKHLRLGFSINDFEATVQKLKALDVPFVLSPVETEFGLMAVIRDPDERKIEIYKK